MITQKPIELIETVADKVAQLVQSEFGVSGVEVTVRKPQAVQSARCVGCGRREKRQADRGESV